MAITIANLGTVTTGTSTGILQSAAAGLGISPPTQYNPNYMVTISQGAVGVKSTNPVTVCAPLPEQIMFDSTADYSAPFAEGIFGSQMLNTVVRLAMGSKFVTQAMTAQFWQGSTESELGITIDLQAETDPISEVRGPFLALKSMVLPSSSATGISSPGPTFDEAIINSILGAAQNSINNVSTAVGTEATTTGTGPLATEIQQVASAASSAISTAKNAISKLVGGGQYVTSGNSTAQIVGGASPTGTASQNNGQTLAGALSASNLKAQMKNQISVKIGNFVYFDSVVITNVQSTLESQIDPASGWPWFLRTEIRFKPLFMLLQNDLQNVFLNKSQNNGLAAAAQQLGQSITNYLNGSGSSQNIAPFDYQTQGLQGA